MHPTVWQLWRCWIHTKCWRYWSSTMHHVIELPASAKVILCFCTPTEPAAQFRQGWRYFVSCLSTHPSTDLALFTPAPCSRRAWRTVRQPQPPGETELWLGSWWSKDKRREEKGNERQWFLFVKKQPGRKIHYSIACMCVLFYCNEMERVTIMF